MDNNVFSTEYDDTSWKNVSIPHDWGIEGDFSKCQNNSIVISRDFAKNKGIKLGDKIDQAFDSALNRPYTVDALIDGSSYCSFYI